MRREGDWPRSGCRPTTAASWPSSASPPRSPPSAGTIPASAQIHSPKAANPQVSAMIHSGSMIVIEVRPLSGIMSRTMDRRLGLVPRLHVVPPEQRRRFRKRSRWSTGLTNPGFTRRGLGGRGCAEPWCGRGSRRWWCRRGKSTRVQPHRWITTWWWNQESRTQSREAGVAAVGLVLDVVDLAGGGGLVAAAGPPAPLVRRITGCGSRAGWCWRTRCPAAGSGRPAGRPAAGSARTTPAARAGHRSAALPMIACRIASRDRRGQPGLRAAAGREGRCGSAGPWRASCRQSATRSSRTPGLTSPVTTGVMRRRRPPRGRAAVQPGAAVTAGAPEPQRGGRTSGSASRSPTRSPARSRHPARAARPGRRAPTP